MSGASVYIKTTIPSFYHEVRTEPDMVARRAWTREWWDEHRSRYDVVTSEAVIDELERGDHPVTERALGLVEDVDRLPIIPEIGEIVEAYVEHQVMPDDPVGDPLHLAVASYHKCDFLQVRFFAHLELHASGKCEQVSSHPAYQHQARAFRPRSRHPS